MEFDFTLMFWQALNLILLALFFALFIYVFIIVLRKAKIKANKKKIL